ncbi:MAG TPA: hypothetical protein VGH19_14075 [Verrucomicrobiae bacterium]
MATKLVIKQDAKLNPHVLDMRPITWEQRREWFKQGLVFTLYWWWGFSILLFNFWIKDEVISWGMILACLVVVPLFFGAGIAGILELRLRLERRVSRTLSISTGHPVVYSGEMRFSWENIEGWHFSSLNDGSGYQKLTILSHRNSHRSDPRLRYLKQWSLIITDYTQVEALKSLLQQAEKDGKPGTRLLSMLPPASEPRKLSWAGISSMVIGITVAIPALLGLIVGCLMLFKKNVLYRRVTDASHGGNFESAFNSFLNHFNSTWEIAWLLVIVGVLTALVGGLLVRWGERAIVAKHQV